MSNRMGWKAKRSGGVLICCLREVQHKSTFSFSLSAITKDRKPPKSIVIPGESVIMPTVGSNIISTHSQVLNGKINT